MNLILLGHEPSAAARVARVDRGHASLRTAGRDLRVATGHLDVELVVGDWLAVDDEGGIAAVLEFSRIWAPLARLDYVMSLSSKPGTG